MMTRYVSMFHCCIEKTNHIIKLKVVMLYCLKNKCGVCSIEFVANFFSYISADLNLSSFHIVIMKVVGFL